MIIYLHGFGSIGAGRKSEALATQFGADNVAAPTLTCDCAEVERTVDAIVQTAMQHNRLPIVFVGTSLGGFYANYFAAKYDAMAVLVNPSVEPHVTMHKRLGTNCNRATGQDFEVTEAWLDQLLVWQQAIADNYNGANVSLFLALDDDVIDSRRTNGLFPFVAHRHIATTGGHRFEQPWPLVVQHIATLHPRLQ
jgi:predicted esterase YcpF (UPF0227 family)